MKTKIVFLTGAGISQESGINTFRDTGGLWEKYSIEEVATPQGFKKNPALVLEFYNQRRKQLDQVEPNQAHLIIKRLEADFEVQIITQNVDDLHERAGSVKVLHIHGELRKMRSSSDPNLVLECKNDIKLGDLAFDGSQLRPQIVWFNEEVPLLETAIDIVKTADILVIVGTSLQVYPAASLINYVKKNTKIYIIDPHIPNLGTNNNIVKIEAIASVGMLKLSEILNSVV